MKREKTRKRVLPLLLAAALGSALALSSCGESAHEHIISEQWSFDDEYHWKVALCDDYDDVFYYSKHNFLEGVCTLCKYKKPTATSVFLL